MVVWVSVALSGTYYSKSCVQQNPIQQPLQEHWDELAQVMFVTPLSIFAEPVCGCQAIASFGFSSLMFTRVLLL